MPPARGTLPAPCRMPASRLSSAAPSPMTSMFPVLAGGAVARCWAGLEGVMPDYIPVISRSREPNAFHAFAFCGHGFQLAPAAGSLVVELIATDSSNRSIEPFRIDRFATAPIGAQAPTPG